MTDNEYNHDLCILKHEEIKKDFDEANKKIDDLKRDIKDFINKIELHDDGIKTEMQQLIGTTKEEINNDIKDVKVLLKDKIIFTGSRIGSQIDTLVNFDRTLKGNGKPSVNEKVRALKWHIRIIYAIITIVVILLFGGNYKGVNLENINNFLSGKDKVKKAEIYQSPIEKDIIKTQTTGNL